MIGDLFAGADLGLERGTVQLAPADPAWAAVFERLAARLRAALPASAYGVEHVGSTAVPGLAAKPVLDVAVGVADGARVVPVKRALEELGFAFHGDAGAGVLDQLFIYEDVPRHRIVNLHLVTHDGELWRRYLVFRDRLRADPELRAAYLELKQDLRRRFRDDRPSYTSGKDAFVAEVVAGER